MHTLNDMMKLIIIIIDCDKDYFLNNNILRFYAFGSYLELSAILKYVQTTILPRKLLLFKVFI